MIFRNITSLLTRQFSWCVIAVDWSGYPSQEYHILRASLLCDGRSIPLLSRIVPSAKQNNSLIQKEFLDELHRCVNPKAKVILITDAGFQSAWFRHIKSLGWDFIGRIRGTVQFCLLHDDERWLKITDVRGKASPEYPGAGWLARAEYALCSCHFYLIKGKPEDVKTSVPEGDYPAQRQKRKNRPQRKSHG
ncbi:transposase IS4 family protein (plasmid) [Salmonella enterica subsp. enterica serovar Weltevreden]|nr:transposase IS4 family protein [Salmonella enterica subsp. enterica serovar Weltevreden]